MQRLSIIIMVVTALAKVFGFARELTLSYFYGAGAISDAYIFANGLPATLFTVLAAAFVSGFIPMFTRIAQRDEKEANQFMSNIFNIMLLFCVVITGLTWLFPEAVVHIFLKDISAETLMYAVAFVRVTIFGAFFVSIVQLTTGYLNIKESFILPAILSLPMNLVVIAFIALSRSTTPYILAYGSLLGNVVQGVIIYAYAYKKGYRHQLRINFADENLKKMLILSIPIIFNNVFNQVGTVITQRIASSEIEGGVSILNYVNKLIAFVQGLFITSITTVTYPSIAKYAALNNKERFDSAVNQSISGMALFVVPAAFAFFALSTPLVTLAFGRGEFGSEQIALASPLFQMLSLGLIGIGIREIFTRVFYAYQDMKSPMVYSIVFVVLNIVLNYVFVYWFNFGLTGLGISSTIAHIVSMVLMTIGIKRRIGFSEIKDLMIDLAKIIASSIIMAAAAYVLHRFLAAKLSSTMITTILTAGVGVIIYGILVVVLKVSFIEQLLTKLKSRFAQ